MAQPQIADNWGCGERAYPLGSLRRTGWHNYSLFLRDDGLLFGYAEMPGTFDEARAAMEAEPVNARWQALMAPYFEGVGRPADQMMQQLDEVFHLDGDEP